MSRGLAKSRRIHARIMDSVKRKLQASLALRTMASLDAQVHTVQAHAAAVLATQEVSDPMRNMRRRVPFRDACRGDPSRPREGRDSPL